MQASGRDGSLQLWEHPRAKYFSLPRESIRILRASWGTRVVLDQPSECLNMLYAKNVPGWERVLRVAGGTGGALAALLLLPAPASWLVAAGVGGLAVSGLLGWCPACAMVGRKLR